MRGHLPRGYVTMKTFKLEIVTPDGSTYSGDVESCVLPGQEGLFGVLPGHSPFMAVLGAGGGRVVQGRKTRDIALSGGFRHVDQAPATGAAGNARAARANAGGR